jgi:hypothetical protein
MEIPFYYVFRDAIFKDFPSFFLILMTFGLCNLCDDDFHGIMQGGREIKNFKSFIYFQAEYGA